VHACDQFNLIARGALDPMRDRDTNARIRDDDELISLDETRELLGGISVSTAYEDPELMALKISMTPEQRRTRMIRFIKREVLALRAERVARAEANAANVRAEIEARVERRRARQRLKTGTVKRLDKVQRAARVTTP
jgi:hypothetical protein